MWQQQNGPSRDLGFTATSLVVVEGGPDFSCKSCMYKIYIYIFTLLNIFFKIIKYLLVIVCYFIFVKIIVKHINKKSCSFFNKCSF